MEVEDSDISQFQEIIRDHSTYDFSDYAITSLRRRLTRILLEYETDLKALNKRLLNDPFFLENTIKKLTVHTTELFRDPSIWIRLRQEILPAWKDRPTVNIWHSGCSSGQEVFSMMMVLDSVGLLDRANIYASDLNPDILEKARTGTYKYHFNQSYLENFDKVLLNGSGESHLVPRKHWKKYFSIDESRDEIRMTRYLTEKPVYKKLDLAQDQNLFLVKFDLIVCRNVIIYFNQRLQSKVFKLYHENLKEDGMLLLGVHESIMGPWERKFRKVGAFYFKQTT